MGKRTSGLTGLSRIALEVFKNPTPEGKDISHQQVTAPTSSGSVVATAQEIETDSRRPTKKVKTGGSNAGPDDHAVWAVGWKQKYDATGLVPHYRDANQVPNHLQKYFSQRKRYFSLYDSGCLLDEEGWYSVTPERVADQIAERCRCTTILDAFCGVGGNTTAFAKTCERVIALDSSPTRLALARHNAQIYGVADRIEFILTDYISFAASYLSSSSGKRKIDVVFLSPPWGGPEYLSNNDANGVGLDATVEEKGEPENSTDELTTHPEYSLASIQPIHGADLFALSRRITPNIAYFLPRNMNMDEISALVGQEGNLVQDGVKGTQMMEAQKTNGEYEMIEVEEEWMATKLKALTCYFGGLVSGQESLF